MKMKLIIESFKKSLKENFPDNEGSERSMAIVNKIMSLIKNTKTGKQAHSLIQGLEMSDDPAMKDAVITVKKEIEERKKILKSELVQVQKEINIADASSKDAKEFYGSFQHLFVKEAAIGDELAGLDAASGTKPDGGMYFI